MRQIFERARAQFIAKFGREPGPGDPVFFDPDKDVPTPLERLLVETDAPYLTPHPYRGSANEPYCLPYTVRAIAELLDRRPGDVADITTSNARRVYGLAAE